MNRISEIISGLRAHQAEEGDPEIEFDPKDLILTDDPLPSPIEISTITQAASAIGGMIASLVERKSYVQAQLDLYNEEMRQIEHVLNYAEPAHAGIQGGAL